MHETQQRVISDSQMNVRRKTQRLNPRRSWLIACGAVALAGCQQQMADQPSYKPLEPCTFFDDGRAARPLVPGTVARGHLRVDLALFTGRVQKPAADAESAQVQGSFDEDAGFVREFPIPINQSVLRHGYNRYMIYCVSCHDPLGTGRGKIVERGYTAPPSYHIERLRAAPVGRLFAVASEGYGSMPSYAEQVPPEDRWAIVAYIRALQLSQRFPESELSPAMRRELETARRDLPPQAGSILEPREDVR
jgi:mono/diheme cytochrome c family protein